MKFFLTNKSVDSSIISKFLRKRKEVVKSINTMKGETKFCSGGKNALYYDCVSVPYNLSGDPCGTGARS